MGFKYSISAIASVSVRSNISLLRFCFEEEWAFSAELTVKNFMCSCMEALRELIGWSDSPLSVVATSSVVGSESSWIIHYSSAMEKGFWKQGGLPFRENKISNWRRPWVEVQRNKFWIIWHNLEEFSQIWWEWKHWLQPKRDGGKMTAHSWDTSNTLKRCNSYKLQYLDLSIIPGGRDCDSLMDGRQFTEKVI